MPGEWKPLKLSPLHHRLLEAGGVLKETGGWLQAERFSDPDREAGAVRSAAGVLDRSPSHKLEARGNAIGPLLASILGGAAPEPGHVVCAEWGYTCRITHQLAILVSKNTRSPVPAALTDEPQRTACIHWLERTHGYGAFWVCGPAAAGIFRKLTSLDLRDKSFPRLSCAAAPLAGVRAVIVRKDAAGFPGYEVLFSREYGEYLWDTLMEAGADFGLRPIGLAAASLLDSEEQPSR